MAQADDRDEGTVTNTIGGGPTNGGSGAGSAAGPQAGITRGSRAVPPGGTGGNDDGPSNVTGMSTGSASTSSADDATGRTTSTVGKDAAPAGR